LRSYYLQNRQAEISGKAEIGPLPEFDESPPSAETPPPDGPAAQPDAPPSAEPETASPAPEQVRDSPAARPPRGSVCQDPA
jgi:hypothetical protein